MQRVSIALNRLGLGARPADPLPADPDDWLLQQFARFEPKPLALSEVPTRSEIVAQLGDFVALARMERGGTTQMQAEPSPAMTTGSTRQSLRRGIREHYLVMTSARLSSALATPAPFIERLVHFWANHFAVSADKLPVIGLAGLLEFEAVRPHVLGRFSDMLMAAARHPTMLLYLDQAQSFGPESQAGRRMASRTVKKRGLNENLAREILELHTLGVRSGYSQSDVTELARALTGWTVSGVGRGFTTGASASGDFRFAEAIHQPGERRVMGRRYGQPGMAQASAILADLAVHPATARHIATKLTRHFAGDEPPPAMIDRLTRAFLGSGGDLPTVYRAILGSPEVWVAGPLKFKSPWEWLVSALRGLGQQRLEPQFAARLLNELAQPTWRPGSPAGWDDLAASWAAPEALARRVEVAQRIAQRTGSLVDPRALAEKLLPGALGTRTRAVIAQAESPAEGLALLLVSPEFVRR